MASQIFRSLSPLCQNSGVFQEGMFLHNNRKYIINNRRGLATKKTEEVDSCDYKVCNKPKKKKSIWKRLFASESDVPPPLPPKECCRLRQSEVQGCDPDLSEFGGQPYRTCGSAYIIQKDILPMPDSDPTDEEKKLRQMESCLDYKDVVNEDPLPKFKSVESKLLDLSDRKIHPLYKKYCPIKKKYLAEQKSKYSNVEWPIDMHEIPARFKIKNEILEHKNMEYLEFKRVEPPRQLFQRFLELKKNARGSMESRKPPVDMREVEKRCEMNKLKNEVYDTLYQKTNY